TRSRSASLRRFAVRGVRPAAGAADCEPPGAVVGAGSGGPGDCEDTRIVLAGRLEDTKNPNGFFVSSWRMPRTARDTMDARKRMELVAQYKDGYRAVAEALTGATDAELDAHPAPGKWSAREIVHHLADSEMTSAIRLRLLLATDKPAILGYDQDEFARRLYYDRPAEASIDAFKAARRTTAEILDRMTDAEW